MQAVNRQLVSAWRTRKASRCPYKCDVQTIVCGEDRAHPSSRQNRHPTNIINWNPSYEKVIRRQPRLHGTHSECSNGDSNTGLSISMKYEIHHSPNIFATKRHHDIFPPKIKIPESHPPTTRTNQKHSWGDPVMILMPELRFPRHLEIIISQTFWQLRIHHFKKMASRILDILTTKCDETFSSKCAIAICMENIYIYIYDRNKRENPFREKKNTSKSEIFDIQTNTNPHAYYSVILCPK